MGEISINHGLRKNLDYLQTDLLRVQLMLFRGALRNGLYDLSDKGSLENNPLIFSGSDSFLSLTSNYLTGIDNIGDIDKSIIKLESEIAIIKKECSHSGITLRLYELQRLFNLSPLDIDILLICLLPEIDSRLEKNFAYLHDDITRKLPTINLILKLLCLTLEESLAAKASFTPEGPLLRNNLIQLSDLPSFQAHHIKEALRLLEENEVNLAKIMESVTASILGSVTEKILDLVRKDKNITHTKLLRKCWRFANADDLNIHLRTLLECRELKEGMEKDGRTRYYFIP